MITVAPFCAAVLALIYVYLAFRVIGRRRAAQISLGSGGNPALERAIRVHANFAEYVPLTLVLLLMLELRHANALLINVLGAIFVIGRCCHAWGMSQESENLRFRGAGMLMTFGTIIAASLSLLVVVLR